MSTIPGGMVDNVFIISCYSRLYSVYQTHRYCTCWPTVAWFCGRAREQAWMDACRQVGTRNCCSGRGKGHHGASSIEAGNATRERSTRGPWLLAYLHWPKICLPVRLPYEANDDLVFVRVSWKKKIPISSVFARVITWTKKRPDRFW